MSNQDTCFPTLTIFLHLLQYMFGALRDCVIPMKCVRHYDSSQMLLDAFQKEITDNFTEVIPEVIFSLAIELYCKSRPRNVSVIHYFMVHFPMSKNK